MTSRMMLVILSALGTLTLPAPVARSQDLYDITTLRSFELTFSQPNWWQLLVSNYNAGQNAYIPGDLTVDGQTYTDVGVRLRGKAAYLLSNQYKKPFKIKMDEFVDGQELYGHDSLRLNNGSEDPTFCREVMMTNLLTELMPMPRANFIKLVINDESWGVYVSEEQKDKKFMNKWFEASTGNRYKSVLGGNLNYLGPNPPPYQALYLNQAENNPEPWTDLIHFCDVLANTPTGPDLTDALWSIFNIDGAILNIASDMAFGNHDSYYYNRNNYYMMHDDHHGQFELINHDLNLSFGTWGTNRPDLRPDYRFQSNLTPLVKRMFTDDALLSEYYAHSRTICEELFNPGVVEPLLTQYMNHIRSEVYNDPKKIFSNQQFEDNVTQTIPGMLFTIPGIMPYVTDRSAYLLAHPEIAKPIVTIGAVEHHPAFPGPNDRVMITASIVGTETASGVELRWRQRGPFQRVTMHDDGLHEDGLAGDGIFGASIPTHLAGQSVEYYVVAKESTEGGVVFSPWRASFEPYAYRIEGSAGPRAILNEFVAKNDTGIEDEQGEKEDWVELLNSDSLPLDLSGMYLTDDVDRPDKWMIPSGTVLAPGDALIVWADEDSADGPYHANFKLDSQGEEIALFDTDGMTLLDAFFFGPQYADTALGRLNDGEDLWVSLETPSPGLSNRGACGVLSYSALDPRRHSLKLAFIGNPREGEQVSLDVSAGSSNANTLLAITTGPHYLESIGGIVLVDLSRYTFWQHLGLDLFGHGSITFTIPNDGSMLGVDLYFQDFSFDSAGNLTLSNGLALRVCP